MYAEDARLVLVATDENGVSVMIRSDETFEVATNPAQMERVVGQLAEERGHGVRLLRGGISR